MEQLVITIDGRSNADLLMRLPGKFNFVKSVSREKKTKFLNDMANVVSEPAGEYNWTNPTRPATDEEFEQMIAECEASPLLTAKEAEELTLKEIKAWRKSRK